VKLVVGLGNPGTKYALTRHNIGFIVADALLDRLNSNASYKNESQFKSLINKLKWRDQDVILAKPQTFMNLSGEAVQPLMSFFKVERPELLVIHDDIDLPFGEFRFHIRRGPGGQNGIRSIHQVLGSDDYARLKMGVGRPADPRFSVSDYVLGQFNEPAEQLSDFIADALDAVEFWLINGTEKAANQFNSPKKSGTPAKD